jgi:hypothetical protein
MGALLEVQVLPRAGSGEAGTSVDRLLSTYLYIPHEDGDAVKFTSEFRQ